MFLLAIALMVQPQVTVNTNGGRCAPGGTGPNCTVQPVPWSGDGVYSLALPRGKQSDEEQSFTCYPAKKTTGGIVHYECIWDSLPQPGCLLFDKQDRPTEQVSCDDPRVQWPTSATISITKQDGTCIAGECAVKFPDAPKEGQCWMDGDTEYCYQHGSWQFVPKQTGMNACAMDQHLHELGAKFDGPDVKGAPNPVGDGKCHYDRGDGVATPPSPKTNTLKRRTTQ